MIIKPDAEMIVDILKNTALFHNIPLELIYYAVNSPKSEWKIFQKKEVIYDQRHFKKSLGILLKGRAVVSKGATDGKKILFNTFYTGDLFGGTAVFQETETFIAEIRAEGECCVFFICQELLSELFCKDVRVVENYIRFLSKSLLFLNKKIDSFTAEDSLGKLVGYLLQRCEMQVEDEVLEAEYSLTGLAKHLNMGRASLYRAIDELTASNLLERYGKQLKVPNIDALKAFQSKRNSLTY